MKNIPISAGIVTYNNEMEIGQCLKTMMTYTKGLNLEIYVYDNHSTDRTLSIIRREFPSVHVIENEDNRGFGYGHNQIVRHVHSKYHMVVNPDIEFTPDIVRRLAEFLEHYPEVGMVTPKIKNLDGTEQFLPKRDPKFSYVILSKFKGLEFYRDEYTAKNHIFKKPTKILSSTGCFFMVRTDVYRKNQGFDERFFMYFEDADFSRRVRQKDAIVFYPNGFVYHAWKRGNTRSIKGMRIFLTSMAKYFLKWRRNAIW